MDLACCNSPLFVPISCPLPSRQTPTAPRPSSVGLTRATRLGPLDELYLVPPILSSSTAEMVEVWSPPKRSLEGSFDQN